MVVLEYPSLKYDVGGATEHPHAKDGLMSLYRDVID